METKKGLSFGAIVSIILLIAKILGMDIPWIAVFAPVVLTTFGTVIFMAIIGLVGMIGCAVIELHGKIKFSVAKRRIIKEEAEKRAEALAQGRTREEYRMKVEKYLREEGLENEGWIY